MNVTYEQQLQTNWCWAACARMAASAFGKGARTQCEVAGHFLGANNCCVDGSSPECNQTVAEDRVGALFASLGLSATAVPSTASTLQHSLSNASIVLVMFDLGNAYHYALLTGYDAAHGQFRVADPRYGQFEATPEQIDSAYNQGSLLAAWRVTASNDADASPIQQMGGQS